MNEEVKCSACFIGNRCREHYGVFEDDGRRKDNIPQVLLGRTRRKVTLKAFFSSAFWLEWQKYSKQLDTGF